MNKISDAGVGSVYRFTPERKSTFSRYCTMDTKNPWREDARAQGVLNYLPNGDLEYRGQSRESSPNGSAHFSTTATMGAVGITRVVHVSDAVF